MQPLFDRPGAGPGSGLERCPDQPQARKLLAYGGIDEAGGAELELVGHGLDDAAWRLLTGPINARGSFQCSPIRRWCTRPPFWASSTIGHTSIPYRSPTAPSAS